MKIKLLALLLALTLTACGDGGRKVKSVTTCPDSSRQERAAFIIECSKAANPLSDEEGEDLVSQCERTASNLYCKTEIVEVKCTSDSSVCVDMNNNLTSRY